MIAVRATIRGSHKRFKPPHNLSPRIVTALIILELNDKMSDSIRILHGKNANSRNPRGQGSA